MLATTSSFPSSRLPDLPSPNPVCHPAREADTVALQLDLATEAALAAFPSAETATRSAARRALESGVDRHLSDLGLPDIARRYRAHRQRRDAAVRIVASATT